MQDQVDILTSIQAVLSLTAGAQWVCLHELLFQKHAVHPRPVD